MDIRFKDLFPKENLHHLYRLFVLKLAESGAVLLFAWEASRIVDGVFLQGLSLQKTAPEFLVLFFAMGIRSLLIFLQKNICTQLSCTLRLQYRQHLHRTLAGASISRDIPSGKLLVLAVETTDTLEEFFQKVLPPFLSLLVFVPIFLIVILCQEPWSALLLLITLPIAPFLLYLIGRITQEANEQQWASLDRLNAAFAELLQGLLMLKIFRRSREHLKILDQLSQEFSAASLKVLQLAFVSSFALELITTLSIAVIAVGIGLRLLHGDLDFFTSFFVLLMAPEFYQPLRQGGTAFHTAMAVRTALSHLQKALITPPVPPQRTVARTTMPPALYLSQVSFQYPDRIDPTLQEITVSFPAGETTLVTGASGSGKSTLLRLLAGLFPAASGTISLNDLPIDRIDPADYQRRLAYVPQEPHIFRATLRENLTLFQDFPDKILHAALRQAALGNWFQSLPQGLDTLLGEQGTQLSNGQRHRLGLARAILQDAPLLLLDETTAGLDEKNEQQIIAFLKDYGYRRTIIFASHRPAVLRAFSHQVQVQDGTIVAERSNLR